MLPVKNGPNSGHILIKFQRYAIVYSAKAVSSIKRSAWIQKLTLPAAAVVDGIIARVIEEMVES